MVGKLGGNSGRARALRRASTDVERKLWRHLQNRGVANAKFRRQVPIGPYIVDFCALDEKLIVEIDGAQHAQDPGEPERTTYLGKHGFLALRFWNEEARENLDGVVSRIAEALASRPGMPRT